MSHQRNANTHRHPVQVISPMIFHASLHNDEFIWLSIHKCCLRQKAGCQPFSFEAIQLRSLKLCSTLMYPELSSFMSAQWPEPSSKATGMSLRWNCKFYCLSRSLPDEVQPFVFVTQINKIMHKMHLVAITQGRQLVHFETRTKLCWLFSQPQKDLSHFVISFLVNRNAMFLAQSCWWRNTPKLEDNGRKTVQIIIIIQ